MHDTSDDEDETSQFTYTRIINPYQIDPETGARGQPDIVIVRRKASFNINDRYISVSNDCRKDFENMLAQIRGFDDEFGLSRLGLTHSQSGLERKQWVHFSRARDFTAARDLCPLRLTSKDPFVSNPADGDDGPNMLSLLSSDVCAVVLTMISGLGAARTMALYLSLRSPLSQFDMKRMSECSVYAGQAYFMERYRQNLFDIRHNMSQQAQLSRSILAKTMSLVEFQRDRERRVREKHSAEISCSDRISAKVLDADDSTTENSAEHREPLDDAECFERPFNNIEEAFFCFPLPDD